MNVRCDECSSMFRVDPAKVPAGGVRARCSVCGGVMRVGGVGTPMASPAVTASAAAATAGGWAAPSAPPPAADPSRATPSIMPPAAPVVAAPAAPPVPAVPSWEREAPPSPAAPDRPAAPIWTSPTDVPTLRHTPPVERSAVPDAGRFTPSPGQPSQAAPRITPRSAPSVPSSASPGAPRRPINPYLSADPQQKARRLARALVSDIVAYHPQKREEGLRTGALKQLFRDEIKKSYEEYVEQVGKEFADSTTHFQDALNDVLAGGRKIF